MAITEVPTGAPTGPTGTEAPTTEPTLPSVCYDFCLENLRIMAVADSSGTIGRKNFGIGKEALTKFAERINVSPTGS